jgi:hypothetical protein
MRTWIRDRSLGVLFVSLFLASWVVQLFFEWRVYAGEQRAHDEPASFWSVSFWNEFGQSTFENWQSEFLQVFVFIVLTTFLVHRKSHESPDTDYDTEAALRRIEAKVDRLERERSKA